jgi:hypothetical protein
VDGQRSIAVLNAQGGIVSKGAVTAVASKSGKSPAYRGTLGKLSIVLWNLGSYYQVRLDAGIPARVVSDEAAAFLGHTPVRASQPPVVEPPAPPRPDATDGPQFTAAEMHKSSGAGSASEMAGHVSDCSISLLDEDLEPVDLEDIPF